MGSKLKYVFYFIAILTIVFIAYLYGYYVKNPHYFFKVDNYKYMDVKDMYAPFDDRIPVLDCNSSINASEYLDVLDIRIFFNKCVMYNLPPKEPYIKEKNKFIYWVMTHEFIVILLMFIVFSAKEIYDQRQKKETFISILINRIKRGD